MVREAADHRNSAEKRACRGRVSPVARMRLNLTIVEVLPTLFPKLYKYSICVTLDQSRSKNATPYSD